MFSSLGFCFRLEPKISETTTCGAEKVGSIDDLLLQILVHLPLKPLFRFKTVSKHWNSIISDPKFQLMRNQAHSNSRAAAGLICQIFYKNPLGMRRFHVSLDTSSSSSNPPHPQIHNIPVTLTIYHSCNGLLVLRTTETRKHPKYDYHYYVYNPTTNQKTTTLLLKDEIRARKRDRVIGMYLAFDPSESPHYKVVCVWELNWKTNHRNLCRFDVYSSETASWERGRVVDAGDAYLLDGVYWNGAIHWASDLGKSVYFNPFHHNGMLRVMPTPPPLVGHTSRGYFLGESLGHLHCAALVGDPLLPRGIDVYEMRRDYSEWFLRYRVDDYSHYLGNSCTVRILFCVVRGESDEDDSFLVLGTKQRQVLRYNLDHNTCETMKVKAEALFDKNGRMKKLFPYIESPCSV